MLLFKELNTKNEELKISLKKIHKNLPKEEKIRNKVILSFSSVWIGQLENCIQDFFLISKTLKELFALAMNSKLFNDSNELLTAKKLENFAYQVCDKIYLKEETIRILMTLMREARIIIIMIFKRRIIRFLSQ